MTTESKLSVWVESSKHIKYDPDQLFDTIVYFCWQRLKHFNREDLPEIQIGVGTEESEGMPNCGMFDVLDDDFSYILLSAKELKNDKYRYKNKIKSLLHMFLHEFYHMYICIDTYLKSDKSMSLYEWQHERYLNYKKECEDMVESGIDEDLTYHYSTEEMAAEAFAFKNLAYLENLYGYGFLVTPPDAI